MREGTDLIKGMLVALLIGAGALVAPAAALANHVGNISYSNPGSAQGIAHRSPTGTFNKMTHDGVNYGKIRVE